MDEHNQPGGTPPQSQETAQQPVAGADKSWAEISGRGPTSGHGHNSRRLLFIVPAVVLLVAGLWYGVGWYDRYNKRHSFESKIKNDPGIGTIPEAQAASADTPLGQTVHGSGNADGIDISVAGVNPDPKTTGDSPSAGMRYIEVDISATNNGKSQVIVPGTFYYRTGTGKLLATATSTGNKAEYPNKDVQVTGKESLDALSLNPGQTDDNHYLIYQVPADDKNGKLVWYEGYYDTGSTKLAVFDLM